jgi:hypothetical protein
MARKINEKQLEQIVTEAATLALERLSFIAESKGKKAMNEKRLNEAVNESLKMVLKEVGETTKGQKKLGKLSSFRTKQNENRERLEKEAQEADEKRRFDSNCERYRRMMKSNENEPFEKRKDAINKFRAGY